MAICCCDTCFLFSLYGSDAHSAAAVATVRRLHQVMSLSPLNRFELANAFRFAEFRRLLPRGEANRCLADFDADLAAGRLMLVPCNLAAVVDEATRLSARHAVARGYRSFDILHVAAAVVMGAGAFLTFDAGQKRLAAAVGLKAES